MSTPTKPASKLRKALHVIELGIALGVAAFIIATLLGSQIAGAIAGWAYDSDSTVLKFIVLVLVNQIGPLVVVPAVAYAAAWLVEGSRTTLVVMMVLTLQLAGAAVRVVSWGAEIYKDAFEVAFLLGGSAVGIALGVWAMGRAHKRIAARDAQVAKSAQSQPAPLSSIDFEAVKKAEAEAVAPAPMPPPAAPDVPKAEAVAPGQAPAAPPSEPGKPPESGAGPKTA